MTHEEWTAKNTKIIATVACPKCKAAAGSECVWGSTHAGNAVHTPRATKFEKLTK